MSRDWIIVSFQVEPVDGLGEMVRAVEWRLAEGEAIVCGISELGPPNPSDFTPLDRLRPKQVVGWIEASIADPEALTAKLRRRSVPPPWEAT